MQIIPQVNTSIIRSVTLLHCPLGMCEFHVEGSEMGDNSSNQVPSESSPPFTQKCVCAYNLKREQSICRGKDFIHSKSGLDSIVSD